MQVFRFTHPLPLSAQVTASKPSCPCKGATYETLVGKIEKIIKNQSGYWYYLDIGITVRDIWITDVTSPRG